jgi:hypothetical protein
MSPKVDWFQSYDGMPEPMPKKSKPSPTPTPKRKKLPDKPKKSKGGVNPSGYTTSIGASGMSFDHKMS